jgi:hypothetical protein
MLDAGWHTFSHAGERVTATATISPRDPHGGQSCLRLSAIPIDRANSTGAIESAPLWATTPGIAVRRGEVVRFSGWLRVVKQVTGSVDGLMVVDSLGGPALAHRVRDAGGWQRFSLVRAAPADGAASLTFALTGLGVVEIDDVAVERVFSTGQSSYR